MERRQIGFVHLKGGVGASLLTAAYAHHWALHHGPAIIIDVQGTISNVFATSKYATQTSEQTWHYKADKSAPVIISYRPSPTHKSIDEQVTALAKQGIGVDAVLIDTPTTDWHRLRRLLNVPIATTTGSVTARLYDDELRELTGTDLAVETFTRSPSDATTIRFPTSPDWDAAASNGMLSPAQLGTNSASASLVRLHHRIKSSLPVGHRHGRRLDVLMPQTLIDKVSNVDDLDSYLCDLVAQFTNSELPNEVTRSEQVRWRPMIEQPTYAAIDTLAIKLGANVTQTLKALLSSSNT